VVAEAGVARRVGPVEFTPEQRASFTRSAVASIAQQLEHQRLVRRALISTFVIVIVSVVAAILGVVYGR
jgi:hypothetical protein